MTPASACIHLAVAIQEATSAESWTDGADALAAWCESGTRPEKLSSARGEKRVARICGMIRRDEELREIIDAKYIEDLTERLDSGTFLCSDQ